ncbi:MAG TPA: sulfurtransferase, partial [Spirochaetes bacterium]|nr:sulfurtransferase [Spirochaetota bacterium]
EHKDDPNLVIVDCPWDYHSYARAHIQGAVCRPGHPYVKGQDSFGQLTLHIQGPNDFKELVKLLGVGQNTQVVLYDDGDGKFATRLWWVLRYYGHEKASILNGGWQGWLSAGYPITYKPSEPLQTMDFHPTPDPTRLTTLDQLKENYNSSEWQVLDTRSDEEYYGRNNRMNKRSGRIPGAIHLEWDKLLEDPNDTGVRRFRSLGDMKQMLDRVGIQKDKTVVTHCQAGIRAAFSAFCLELIGYPTPRMYDASMAEWANLDDTPLE